MHLCPPPNPRLVSTSPTSSPHLPPLRFTSLAAVTFGGWVKILSLPSTTTYDPSSPNYSGVRHVISSDANGLLKGRAIVVEEGRTFSVTTGSKTVDPTSHSPNLAVYSPLTAKAAPHMWTFVAAVYNAKTEKASIYVDGEVS